MPRISAAHIYCAALIKECRVAIDIQWILDDASLARHCAEWRKLLAELYAEETGGVGTTPAPPPPPPGGG